MLIDYETLIREQHSDSDRRASVTLRDDRYPFWIVLFFTSTTPDATLIGVEADAYAQGGRGERFALPFFAPPTDGAELTDTDPEEAELDPAQVTQAMADLELYVLYARAMMLIEYAGDPDRVTDFPARRRQLGAALEMLRDLGRTRRGLTDTFYRLIGQWYSQQQEHPIVNIARGQNVDISTASRWVKEARQRGYIKEGEERA